MILAVGAIHSNLVKLGLRGYSSINVQTAEAMDTHSFAVLDGSDNNKSISCNRQHLSKIPKNYLEN